MVAKFCFIFVVFLILFFLHIWRDVKYFKHWWNCPVDSPSTSCFLLFISVRRPLFNCDKARPLMFFWLGVSAVPYCGVSPARVGRVLILIHILETWISSTRLTTILCSPLNLLLIHLRERLVSYNGFQLKLSTSLTIRNELLMPSLRINRVVSARFPKDVVPSASVKYRITAAKINIW